MFGSFFGFTNQLKAQQGVGFKIGGVKDGVVFNLLWTYIVVVVKNGKAPLKLVVDCFQVLRYVG